MVVIDNATRKTTEASPHQVIRSRWNNRIRALGFALWIFPMAQFWVRFFPPLRPFDFLAPAPSWAFWVAAFVCCAAPYALPLGWFKPLWFENRQFYERLGVRLFRQIAPDGDWVNRRLRTLAPDSSLIRNRSDASRHIRDGVIGERAHLAFLLAGLITTVYALRLGEPGPAAALCFGNAIYNFYPLLLQRYKRARLKQTCRAGHAH
jgi:hypothetical protein